SRNSIAFYIREPLIVNGGNCKSFQDCDLIDLALGINDHAISACAAYLSTSVTLKLVGNRGMRRVRKCLFNLRRRSHVEMDRFPFRPTRVCGTPPFLLWRV